MRCRHRSDCPDTAVAIVNGQIVCAHHGALVIDVARADRGDWTANPLPRSAA